MPLKELKETTTGELSFTSNELGLYTYKLNLKATAPGPEKAIHFSTYLGSSSSQPARFLNYARANKVDFKCEVTHSLEIPG